MVLPMRHKNRRTVESVVFTDGIAFEQEDDNLYAQSVNEGHGIDARARKILVVGAVLVVVYVLGLLLPNNMLNFGYLRGMSGGGTLSWVVQQIGENVSGLAGAFSGQYLGAGADRTSVMIMFVVIAISGAGLALCGSVYQGTFDNPLISPSTLGVMAGGSFGLILWVVLFVPDEVDAGNPVLKSLQNAALGESGQGVSDAIALYLANSLGMAAMSFVGCLLVVGIVLLTARLAGWGSGSRTAVLLIITGQVVASIVGAASGIIRYYYATLSPYGAKSELIRYLSLASFFRNYTWVDILALSVPLVVVFAVIFHLRQRMMLLSFSEGEARTMGVDSQRMRTAVVLLCTLLTAIIISFCGAVGFVGFLVPHLARRIVGPNFKYLLPATAMLGAVFVLTAYVLLMKTVGVDYASMVGSYISIGGCIVFLVTTLKGGGRVYGKFY